MSPLKCKFRYLVTQVSVNLSINQLNGNTLLVQVWKAPEGIRRLRFPDFMAIGI